MPSLAAGESSDEVIQEAAKLRREGNLRLAIELLEKACASAAGCSTRTIGELGATYYQAHRLQDAETALKRAYAHAADDSERALFANDLGNLSASRGRSEEAAEYYKEARNKGAAVPAIAVSAGLNLARMTPAAARLRELQSLSREIPAVPDTRERARYWLNLGAQARTLGDPALRLAYESLNRAQTLSAEAKDHWLRAEALDTLAQLYEDRGRGPDALKLTDDAIGELQSEPAPHMLINLQWRRGRLLHAQGRDDQALQAYQSAVDRIEEIRQDIPVEYVDGRSSFRETLEPVYLGLADLLLRRAANGDRNQQTQLFNRARDAVELIKQTELQDYLGDRCLVESARPLRGSILPPHTAVFYPVILEDRLELLLETSAGIEGTRSQIGAAALREKALAFAAGVREGRSDYLERARELYDLLLRPLERTLSKEQIDTLVIVPDGVLRLIPMGALHDGERFVVVKFNIATVPGLSIASAVKFEKEPGKVLLAGLSEPGPVVDKLPKHTVEQMTHGETTRGVRSVDVKEGLALPGVTEEIRLLKGRTNGDRLLNSEFTVERFRQQVSTGSYRIVHIASHAMFSQRAETSFILAYDDVLTIDELQTLLRSDQLQSNPIDLLSLSACQTAEGDDRAPLGIAGAALRAHAGSALGSLWPVDDEATKTLMVRFYELLTTEHLTKAEALRRAQVELLQSSNFKHPFYWAPFILVGGWL